jgi:hypothetical protein
MKPITYYVDLPDEVATAIANLCIRKKISLAQALLEQCQWHMQGGEDYDDLPNEELVREPE